MQSYNNFCFQQNNFENIFCYFSTQFIKHLIIK
nr:MAG TPA: hypothetical protein [Caudoviricetes sp.]